uniref:Uncharacterized protein n=1 Tax=Romanomermis culicivorax TaxID=13658 RepID=A0A915HGU2_ROMCU
MPNHSANSHQSNTQPSSSVHADEVCCFKQETARLMAHVAKLWAQQHAPAPNQPTPPQQPWMPIQAIRQCSSGAHLQTCSFHGLCMHSNADCGAKHPASAVPVNNITNGGRCYFCCTHAHTTDR